MLCWLSTNAYVDLVDPASKHYYQRCERPNIWEHGVWCHTGQPLSKIVEFNIRFKLPTMDLLSI